MGAYQLDSSKRRRTCLPVTLEWPERARKTLALLDSGAKESFLDATVAAQWGVPLVEVSKPLVTSSLNGQRLGCITWATRPLKIRISGNHQEEISLLIIDTPHSPVVLGHPWMAKHQPQVDWARHEILEWDPSCSSHCLKKPHAPVVTPQREEFPNLARIPKEYHDLVGVFCKSRVMTLPPHRPYDCAIEVQSGATPPRGRIFSLSRPEREAMEKYLAESLAAGIIRPSSSPACAGFFFVGKEALHQLPGNERDDGAQPVPAAVDGHGIRPPTRRYSLHQAEPSERLSLGEDQGGRRAVFQTLVNDVLGDMINKFYS